MRIEIPKQGRMDMTGSALLRLIQNNHMPLLDLFVRESIQNSLDAAKLGVESVGIDFLTGSFNNEAFAEHLEGITDALKSKFKGKQPNYIAIRDRHTVGLTGPLHFSQSKEGDSQNLSKLVYDIAKPQEQAGAGGSWGLGKTIFFRMGIGLVLYYSRVQLGTGEYQSRLAACLVEDEKKKDSLLAKASKESKRGLAWWGDEFSFIQNGSKERHTIPITNEKEIESVISVFNIEPFREKETGTLILVPYIDKEYLLRNNIVHSDDPKVVKPFWINDIETYLKIAVQRWYFGRLNNPLYYKKIERPFLTVKINEEFLDNNGFLRTFECFQQLYNIGLSQMEVDGFHSENIIIRKDLETTDAGTIIYKIFDYSELDMLAPNNLPHPAICINNEVDEAAEDRIIITHLRKPAMAVGYHIDGEWAKYIRVKPDTDQVLLGVFILNSNNKFANLAKEYTLEDYFRDSEEADHLSWHDLTVENIKYRILNKIQMGIGKRVNTTYADLGEDEYKRSSSLSKYFGELLLPPTGFGKKATKSGSKPKTETGSVFKHKNVALSVFNEEIEYGATQIKVPMKIIAKKPVLGCDLTLSIAGDGREISLDEWEDVLKLPRPFEIATMEIIIKSIGDEKLSEEVFLSQKNRAHEAETATFSLIRTLGNCVSGLKIHLDSRDVFELQLLMNINIIDNAEKINFKIKESETV